MIDKTDQQILSYLQKNSRMQWQEIGKLVHLTGQAVAARILRMQDAGVIKGFTVNLSHEKLGKPISAFITVFMKSAEHNKFQHFLADCEAIEEAHRISGEGCYWIKAMLASQKDLNELLDTLLNYGNYKVTLSINKLKG